MNSAYIFHLYSVKSYKLKLKLKRAMSTFVLVHGSCHGGWCWKKLTPILRKNQHEVYTPTLTGLGERSHWCQKMLA